MRYICGTLLLALLWPLLILFDIVCLCFIVTIFIWADNEGPFGVNTGLELTKQIFK